MSSDESIAQSVQQYGYSRIVISDIEPPFVYTVGLMFTYNHPEAILFGQRDTAAGIIASMVGLIRAGRRFDTVGEYDNVLVNAKIAVRPVHRTQHEFYLGYAMGYCRERGRTGELQAVELFWPDQQGRFPFQRGCDENVWAAQPRLDQPLGPLELEERRQR
jgi:hypothetical protein